MGSLGCHTQGVCLPHPDPADPPTLEAGVRKRFAFKPPDADLQKLERLRSFVRGWLRKHLTPLDPHADTSVEGWLAKCPYPAWRKDELMRKHLAAVLMTTDGQTSNCSKMFRCKSFMKDETYLKYKHARAINSRTDEFKTFVGPIFKLIEEQLFKLDWFIKKVPVADRPQFIKDRIFKLGAKYFATDFTSFEALFTAELMNACEMELYRYMVSDLPGGQEFLELLEAALLQENECVFKFFTVWIRATRMSGEMCTSLGNGFSNLMFFLFLCSELGSEAIGVVEGDDGLFAVTGQPPTSDDFKSLGLVIKMEEHTDLCTASFCGLIFDEEDCINVTDPREELATFGWCPARYARSRTKIQLMMLRCKALSMAHQYPGCPILSALAQYGLRVTREVRFYMRGFMEKQGSHLSTWEREQVLAALRDEAKVEIRIPPMRTRLLVERQFGVTIAEQLAIESKLDSMTKLEPFTFDLDWPEPWCDYFDRYVSPDQGSQPSLKIGAVPIRFT